MGRLEQQRRRLSARPLFVALLCVGAAARIGLAVAEEDDLQRKLANPVAEIVTLPLQYNGTSKVGADQQWLHQLNLQPVYPVALSERWRLINRAVIPLVSQPALVSGQERQGGIGDISYEAFFSPLVQERSAAGKWIWGFGPTFQLDTASDDRLGSGKWAAGPALLALFETAQVTIGGKLLHLSSFAGDDAREDFSQTQLQPIVSYRLDPTYSLDYIGTVIVDWKQQRSSQRWTVPMGVSLSMLTRSPGFIPVNYQIGGGYNLVRPDDGGDWFIRFQVSFILPKSAL